MENYLEGKLVGLSDWYQSEERGNTSKAESGTGKNERENEFPFKFYIGDLPYNIGFPSKDNQMAV